MRLHRLALLLTAAVGWQPLVLAQSAATPRFERIVIDDNMPGGYQVEIADVNGDKKPDIVALGGSTIAWYENPTWKKRIIATGEATHGVISSATTDLDGDGHAEIAIAYDFSMNEPKRGKLLLATQGPSIDAQWKLTPMVDVPSIHRLRWGDIDGDGHPELVVAPIFGPEATGPAFDNDPARLAAFFPFDAKGALLAPANWPMHELARCAVMHAIEVSSPRVDDHRSVIHAADKNGVTRVEIPPGSEKQKPKVTELLDGTDTMGASEIHLGKLGKAHFVATIEPWHGSEVVIYLMDHKRERIELDTTLDLGHALWVADVDGDGYDEVFAGHRGQNACVSAYHFDGKTWHKQVLDPKLTAQDMRGGDLDGDGTPDIVAIGGASKNVVWFKPVK